VNVEKLLLTEGESCVYVGAPRSTFRKRFVDSGLVQPIRLGRALRFRPCDLAKAVEYLFETQNGDGNGC
jgi:hypothetical protein